MEFSTKFRKLKSLLQDFSKKYPHEKNPANIYTLLTEDINNKDNNNNNNNNNNEDINSLKSRQEQLERMVNALLSRLEKSKQEIEAKDNIIAKMRKKDNDNNRNLVSPVYVPVSKQRQPQRSSTATFTSTSSSSSPSSHG